MLMPPPARRGGGARDAELEYGFFVMRAAMSILNRTCNILRDLFMIQLMSLLISHNLYALQALSSKLQAPLQAPSSKAS